MRSPGAHIGHVLVAGLLLGFARPSASAGFKVDLDLEKASNMKVITLTRPLVLAPGGRAVTGTVQHPEMVTAVRLHAKVSAPPGAAWAVRFKTLSVELVEEVKPDSPQVVNGEVWSGTIPGPGSIVEVEGPASVSVTIDAYAHIEARTTPQAIHGAYQLIPIRQAPPEAQRYASAVGRLRFMTARAQAFCSGFLVGADLFMTNNHCIATPVRAASAFVELGYDGYSTAVSSHRVSNLEVTDRDLDVTVLRLATQPAASWGRLTLGQRPSRERLPLVIVQHPAGRPKEASVDDCVSSGLQVIGLGAGRTDFGHECDTEGGSSGSPVIDPTIDAVVGLHHLGFDPDDPNPEPNPVNQAVQMERILSILSPALRAELSVRP
jgi:hypothetical protein